jgi:hypothetical protein
MFSGMTFSWRPFLVHEELTLVLEDSGFLGNLIERPNLGFCLEKENLPNERKNGTVAG